MIDIVVGTIVYTATLIGCYDGDTCKVKFNDAPDILAEQTFRFEGFDTPEIRGKCQEEKDLAKLAKKATLYYMENVGVVYSEGKRGKYGRLLVTTPDLQNALIENGLARPYDGGKRKSWCN
jgi:endonuclease YncB( thermonuclease family)|tara:strand:+ start:100 stop:462 length:363 start_codon:yes stop_codon:yes gene_type:complete